MKSAMKAMVDLAACLTLLAIRTSVPVDLPQSSLTQNGGAASIAEDGVHPTALGSTLIAGAWLSAEATLLRSRLAAGTTTAPPRAVSRGVSRACGWESLIGR